jgi:hypothetical protein
MHTINPKVQAVKKNLIAAVNTNKKIFWPDAVGLRDRLVYAA